MRLSIWALLPFAIVALSGGTSAGAAPVEYVKICSAAGIGFYYIPGTDICANANTGETVDGSTTGLTQTEQDALDAQKYAKAAQEASQRSAEGVAMTMALPGTLVDDGKHFGASVHVGTFGGYGALGVGGAFRLNPNVTFDGGLSVGTTYGQVGGRAGLNVSW